MWGGTCLFGGNTSNWWDFFLLLWVDFSARLKRDRNDLTPLEVEVFAVGPNTGVRLGGRDGAVTVDSVPVAGLEPVGARSERHILPRGVVNAAAGSAVDGGSRAPPPPWDRNDAPLSVTFWLETVKGTGTGVETPGATRPAAFMCGARAGLLSRGPSGRRQRSAEDKATCVHRRAAGLRVPGRRWQRGGPGHVLRHFPEQSEGGRGPSFKLTAAVPQGRPGFRLGGPDRRGGEASPRDRRPRWRESRGEGQPPCPRSRRAAVPSGSAIASATSRRLKVRTGAGARGGTGREPRPEAALHQP